MYLVAPAIRTTEQTVESESRESKGDLEAMLGILALVGFACGPIVAAVLTSMGLIEVSSAGAVMVNAGLIAGGLPLAAIVWSCGVRLRRRSRVERILQGDSEHGELPLGSDGLGYVATVATSVKQAETVVEQLNSQPAGAWEDFRRRASSRPLSGG